VHFLAPICMTVTAWTSARQGLCAANLHSFGLASSDKCKFGMLKILSDGGLQRLHSAGDYTTEWL